MRRCSKCKDHKPEADFYSTHQSWCKPCIRQQRREKAAGMYVYRDTSPEVRFREKVQRVGDCDEWTAKTSDHGHGIFYPGPQQKAVRAHRWIWEQTYGPIPDGLFVCHHCDNPPCVRLEHLFLGTQVDNMQDMSRKGRWRNQYNSREVCIRGHDLTDAANVGYRKDRNRNPYCKPCSWERSRKAYAQTKVGVHG